MIPVAPGITPGSGPGHLGLFGYDPLEFQVGRGVIEALGLGMELKPGDVCARANFATLDAKGIVTDRRAGRIATEICEKLCAKLSAKIKKIGDTEIIIKAGKEHRFVVIFRGKGLEGPLTDADPNREGFADSRPFNRAMKIMPARKKWPRSSPIFTKPRCRLSRRKNRRTVFSCAASRISRTSRFLKNAIN